VLPAPPPTAFGARQRPAETREPQPEGPDEALTSPGLVAGLLIVTAVCVPVVLLFTPALLRPVGIIDVVSAVPAFALFFTLGLMGVLLRAPAHRSPFRGTNELRLYVAAFALRAFVAVALSFSFQFDDEAGLHGFAVEGGKTGGYVQVLKAVYAFLGANLVVAKAMNVALGSLLVVLVADLVEDPRVKRYAQLLALVCPPLVIYSSVNLKETGTALLLVVALSGVVRVLRREASVTRGVVLLAGGAGGLWLLRGAAWAALGGVAILGGVGIELLVHRRDLPRGRILVLLPAMFAAVAFAGPAVAQSIGKEYLSQRVGPQQVTNYFTDRTYAAGSGVTGYLDPNDPLGARNLVVLWGRGMFVPSPFRAVTDPTAARTVEVAGTLGWYAMLLAGFAGAARALHRTGTPAILGAAGLLSFATASLSSLGADPARHRVVVVPLLCALAAAGLVHRPRLPAAVAAGIVTAGMVGYNGIWVYAWLRGTVLA
jgi:hypothetical protein